MASLRPWQLGQCRAGRAWNALPQAGQTNATGPPSPSSAGRETGTRLASSRGRAVSRSNSSSAPANMAAWVASARPEYAKPMLAS